MREEGRGHSDLRTLKKPVADSDRHSTTSLEHTRNDIRVHCRTVQITPYKTASPHALGGADFAIVGTPKGDTPLETPGSLPV